MEDRVLLALGHALPVGKVVKEEVEEAQGMMECEAQPDDEGVGLAEGQGVGEALV